MNISVKHALAIGLLLLVPVQKAAKAKSAGVGPGNPPPRIPSGIYAVIPVEQVLKEGYGTVAGYGSVPVPSSKVNSYLSSFYQSLLNNSAVSGLALQVHWDTLNPNPPGDANAYSWDYVQDAFTVVEDWNSKNPTNLKSIQLIVTPGFNSPLWMRDELSSCDPLFEPTFTGHVNLLECGEVTFIGFVEKGDSTELPLPWNT